MSSVALVDMGSNTVRMNVYNIENNEFQLLFTTKKNLGLAGYIIEDKMSMAGIKAAIDALFEFQSVTKQFNVDHFVVFATAALRNVKNSQEAILLIEKETSTNIHVISGEEEATLDFIGAKKVISSPQGVLVDIGGGSTEIVVFEDNVIVYAISIPVGSLNLYKKAISHLLPNKKERKTIKKLVNDELDSVKHIFEKEYFSVIGVGGTIRAGRKLSQSIFDKTKDDNDISISELKKLIKFISKDKRENLDVLLHHVSDRIHTITPGLLILKEVCKRFNTSILTVSDYGVREGYLIEHIMNQKDE